MTTLTQNPNAPMFYTGWYGICGDCENFELISGTGINSKYVHSEIQFAFATSGNSQGTISFDGLQTIPALIGIQVLKKLECGKSYEIILKPGTGSLEIPNFVFSTISTDDEYRATDDCDLHNATPTPTPTPTPSPTPTPTCTPKLTWEVRTAASNKWSLRTGPADVLIETDPLTLCTTDFIYSQQCGDNNFATSQGWFDGDFSKDIKNIKYTDCDGNEYEPSSVEYKTYAKECGTQPASSATGVDFKLCFYLGEQIPVIKYVSCDSSWTPIEVPLFELPTTISNENNLVVKYTECNIEHNKLPEIFAYQLPSPTTRESIPAIKYISENCGNAQNTTEQYINSIKFDYDTPEGTTGVADHDPTKLSTDTTNQKTLPTEWPVGTTYIYD